MAEADRTVKAFLFPRMYRHSRILQITQQVKAVVSDLFAHFSARPQDMPADWNDGLAAAGPAVRARRVGDFIAGMTDNFALAEHARYFDSPAELR
jgi:dGTPase